MAILSRHPQWLKVRVPAGPGYQRTRDLLQELRLNTVCQEAHCPNVAECWGHGTATFMLMGDVCTRNCPYCAVAHGKVRPLDPEEPWRVAQAARRLGLSHVVVTSVDRDDLPDGGAAHFAATARAIKAACPEARIEVLVPDFKGKRESIETVVDSPVVVFNHNIETVPRLYRVARPGGRYARSLDVLRYAKEFASRSGRSLLSKTGLMLGLGEEIHEVLEVLRDLRDAGCDILTLGQYLRPSKDHLPVVRYVHPDEFDELKERALAMGFRYVESGPLVRSSYHAWRHVL